MGGFGDRRARWGDQLSDCFLDRTGTITFAELSASASEAWPGEITRWLGEAISAGHVRDIGIGEQGAREYVLTPRGRRVLSYRRRISITELARTA
jgi:hypothetical protein